MEIRLKPEHEAMVQAGMDSGRFATAEAYIAEAVEMLHLRLAYEEESRLLDESIAQGERGELFTEDEIRRDLDELKAQWSARQSAA